MNDPFAIDVNPPSKKLAKALDRLADSTAALHAATTRLTKANCRFERFLIDGPCSCPNCILLRKGSR